MPDQLLQKMVVPNFNFTSHLLVSINNFSLEPEVREKMNSLVETIPTVTMETLHNLYQDSEAMYQRTSLVIWGLSGFIMLFAVINLINTLIATTLSRKHEFSTLRSIGMEKKQLQWTIQWEGILLAFWNIGITLAVGTPVGYIMRPIINSLTWFQFDFTIAPLLVAYPILLMLAIIIPLATYRTMAKESIVKRLRTE